MELGTIQVIEGTYLVEDTKKSLGQILNVSLNRPTGAIDFECYSVSGSNFKP